MGPDLVATARFILETQHPSGAIPWFHGGIIDPWDHVEAAMGLASVGYLEAAHAAYAWLQSQQGTEGGWYVAYNEQGVTDDSRIETNFVAYIAVGIWHTHLIQKDLDTLRRYWPMVEKAIDFVIDCQGPLGQIYWAKDSSLGIRKDALITGCSSIFKSLACALSIAEALGEAKPEWQHARGSLQSALLHHPEAFDCTWESKARFSMDWFYPILAGVITGPEANARIEARWHEFVVQDLGCRCVNDEPWVTVAETCELVMSLAAMGDLKRATQLFSWIQQFREVDGSYWTGYVFRDDAIWPEEKTTWTAGAVLLASDMLSKRSPGHTLFHWQD